MPRATLTAAAGVAGVTRQAASRARHAGRIGTDADGTVDAAEAKAVLGQRKGRPAKLVTTTATGETLAAVLLRKETALADIRSMEAAKMRGALLPAGEVLEGWQGAISRARSLLLRIPTAIAPEVVRVAPEGRQAVTAVLTKAIHNALHELADTRAESLDDDEAEA